MFLQLGSVNVGHILLAVVAFFLGLSFQFRAHTKCISPTPPSIPLPSHLGDRNHWPPVFLGRNIILCQVLGHKMFLDTRDVGIVPHLCTDGIWESHIESVVRRTVKPGWRVVDVGANFGYYSVLLGNLIGRHGSGLVIEAIPDIYALLSLTIEVNGYGKIIKLMNYAALDQRGTVTFNVRPSRQLNSHFVQSDSKSKDISTIQVPAMTIDAMIAERWDDGMVNFIKIDIEGAEARAWKGMQETLRKNKDNIVVIIEVNTQRLKSMKEDYRTFFNDIQKWFRNIRRITNNAELEPITVAQLQNETSVLDHMLFLSNNVAF